MCLFLKYKIMKKLIILFFIGLLFNTIACKKDPTSNNCTGVYCIGGSTCNPISGKCECPEGEFFAETECTKKEPYMYFPVEQNQACFCFYEISAIWIDTTFNALLFDIKNPLDGRSHAYNIGGFQLKNNPDTSSQWKYLDKFVSDYTPLNCKLGDKFVNAHVYFNISGDSIHMQADFVPYIEGDWLHLEEYPVLETYELLFVR